MYARSLIPLSLGALLMGPGAAPSGCGEEELTCEERVELSSDYVYGVVDEFQACTEDSDCTLASPGTECRGTCPVAMNKDGLDELAEAVAYANQTWCQDFFEDGCPYASPMCVFGTPACEGGQCVSVTEF